MNDSAARAERFEPVPSITPCYTWEVPQKPVLVRLPLLLIDRLERETVENFRSVSSQGSEIGGILWGIVEPGQPNAVSVAEYDLLPCDYSLGPLYRLSEADLARLDRAVAQRGGSALRAVGFFRSHTRKGLALDADDLALMESRFPEPHQVMLVVRPYATKASTGGIFIRENGAIHAEASYLEFPFRSALLAPTKHLADAVETAANNPAAPAAPKPTVRAQIVPIASRREAAALPPLVSEAPPPPAAQPSPQAAPEPVAQAQAAEARPAVPQAAQTVAQPAGEPTAKPVVEPTAQAAVKPVAEPVAQPAAQPVVEAAAKAAAPTAAKSTEKTSEKPVAESRAATLPGTASIASAEKSKPAEASPEESVGATPARGRGGSKLLWFAVAAILVLLGGVLFVYPGVLHHTTAPGAGSGQDTSPLALRVESTGSELLLTWNNDSRAIRNATRAVLSISDGEQHENVEMDLAQLRNGRIEYLPVTGDVVFRMEVSGKDNAKTASESVRVLRTRPSPMPTDAQAAANQPGKPPAPNAASNPATAATTPASAPAPNGAAPNATPNSTAGEVPPAQASAPPVPLKQFNAAALSARLRPVASNDVSLPDAPAVGRGETVTASDSALKLTAVAPPAMPAGLRKSDPTPAPAPPKQSAVTTGGDVQTAQLIWRKNPEYPALARSAGAKGTVELIATIGTNGRVKTVKVTKGHPLLQKAAVDAVMQWQYKPTMLNGHPVETDTTITLNFVSDR